MPMNDKTDCFALFLFTEAPLHAGAGPTLTAIDLPIQREVHTQHPVVWASGVKGALRDMASGGTKEISKLHEAIFGPDTKDASEHGGLAMFSEARVILFPAAESAGIFVWVTCPMVLERLKRDLRTMLGAAESRNEVATKFLALEIPNLKKDTAAFSGSGGDPGELHFDAGASLQTAPGQTAKATAFAVWLASHAFPSGDESKYWRELLPTRLAIVPDDEFHFLVNYATQLQSHVKIGATGTVVAGPWIEESLPSETLLMAPVVVPPVQDKKVRDKLKDKQEPEIEKKKVVEGLLRDRRFQLGGGRSTGMGWVAARLFTL